MAEDRSVLDIVENIDRKLDEHAQLHQQHVERLDGHDTQLSEHGHHLRTHDTQLSEQASLLVKIGQAAAAAVDHALEAKRAAGQSVDEATKIVESAIRMHSASIATTVQAAVKAEIAPIVADMVMVKASDQSQTTDITSIKTDVGIIKTAVAGIAKALGHPYLRLLIVLCIALGTIGGAAYAAYAAQQAADQQSKPALSR